jgi:serine acetyltransferase
MPWPLKRWYLVNVLGYELHPTSHIGFSLIMARKVVLEKGARIGHLNRCQGLDLLHLSAHSMIGKLNWITGYPSGDPTHFAHQPEREPSLILKEHAAISNRHLLDCTAKVVIGPFATFAGFRSQILTHSVDLEHSRQAAEPVEVGAYAFVGTDCILLGGSSLPDRSVLAAKSLLNKKHAEEYTLYGGVPAKPIKQLPSTWAYFHRKTGFIY